MKFGSVCSGIEAASVAFNPLGWEASWFAEIEPFPSAVLAHHYPQVPNVGDMTKIVEMLHTFQLDAPDMLCGGTPCQAFSVAGLRNSLDDARGNLSLIFCEIANAIDTKRTLWGEQPAIIFWENVPGVLSTKDNAFGCFLAGLAGEDDALVPPGGKWSNAGYVSGPQRNVAWRVLDAQYFGVAQRRRRVFVVASARAGFDPAAVLFEFDGVRRNTAPSRGTGQEVAGTIEASAGTSRGAGTPTSILHPDVAQCLTTRTGQRYDPETETETILPFDTTQLTHPAVPVGIFQDSEFGVKQYDSAGTIRAGRIPEHQMVLQPLPFDTTQVTSPANHSSPKYGDPCHPLAAQAHVPAVAYGIRTANTSSNGWGIQEEVTHTLDTAMGVAVATPINTQMAHPLVAQAHVPAVAFTQVTDCLTSAYATKWNGNASATNGSLFASQQMQVRRLTPVECARLQGFPDDYLNITFRKKPAADGPKYKALGNSWAVPNVAWIGRRIKAHLEGEL